MCGIAGFFDSDITEATAGRLIDAMLQAIKHRGPDASNVYFHNGVMLGHNRLSIIDLSQSANQPMFYDQYVLVFNGEIYNYIEIKELLLSKGHRFITQSDSEVILAAYKEWGPDCVHHFMGMWAFVIYDTQQKQLFISRDRFGIKPFYYITESGRFYFASEIKALRHAPCFSNHINLLQVSRSLQLGWTGYYDETIFEKVKALPASHNMVVSTVDGSWHVVRYYDIKTGERSGLSFEEKCNRFFQLFGQSVKQHMRSDVPVATCLSGGLDSSAIVSMVQYLNPGSNYKSFSIYYDGAGDVDERPYIDEVIKKYPSVTPYYKQPVKEEVAAVFHNALYHADVPATGSSFISQYFLMQLIASQKIKVVLDGQGSDEYLAGYMHTFYRLIGDCIREAHIGRAFNISKAQSSKLRHSVWAALSHLGKSMLTVMYSEQQLYWLEYRKYYPFLLNQKIETPPFKLPMHPGNMMDDFLYNLMYTTSLPALLQYEDRNSMAFSIESRVPFLDHRLVEFAFTLANHDKIQNTETKYILRQSLKGILPDAVAARQDKKGFVTPGESKWLRGPLKHLTEINTGQLDFLDRKKINDVIESYNAGSNKHALLMWRLCTLNYWLKNFA